VKKDNVANKVSRATISERIKKLVQFSICFHLLFEGKPMIDYENMSKLLQLLDI
jgi:hypothetical protein